MLSTHNTYVHRELLYKKKALWGIRILNIHVDHKVQRNSQLILEFWFHEGQIEESVFILHNIEHHNHAKPHQF